MTNTIFLHYYFYNKWVGEGRNTGSLFIKKSKKVRKGVLGPSELGYWPRGPAGLWNRPDVFGWFSQMKNRFLINLHNFYGIKI